MMMREQYYLKLEGALCVVCLFWGCRLCCK